MPHICVYEIRAAAQVHRGQRDACAGVGNRSGPLRRRRTVDLRDARITLRALRALRPRRTLRSLQPGVALRPLSTLRALAIQRAAGAVVVHVLGAEVALAILVQIPAIQAVSALRALSAGVTLRTRAALRP